MSGQYGIDQDAHAAATQKMADTLEETRATVRQSQASVDAVLAGWKGQSSQAMLAWANTFHEKVTKLNTHIDAVQQALDKGRNTAIDAEDSNAQPFTTLA
ncbi:WXG100 family type VII secretion target [Nocardia sp. CDC160]|uniref:WXG100 family type VII secretion target n=1 Tax=Nocardia sp. CDC160 TaxID=3112166 RepID=UPI002DBD7262|nr:WXG100 family type VII secretion target [Nocardia sp. CDC160]MEC3919251.1 WXG100 family type VII secretion target [Nocardia sp. CDC160]